MPPVFHRIFWLLTHAVLPRDIEALIGDLEEERLLRSRSAPPQEVAGWYRRQIVRSVPHLLWAALRRGRLPTTVAIAVVVCLLQAIIELTMKSVLLALLVRDVSVPALATLFVSLPALVFLSYVATRIRPGAALLLAGLIVLAVSIQLIAEFPTRLALWNQIVALLSGPSAALAGGALAVRRAHTGAQR